MAGKYWETDEFLAEMNGLQEPEAIRTRYQEVDAFDARPSRLGDTIPEWWWVDVTEEELHLNVHQTYFDIAKAGLIGGTLSYVKKDEQIGPSRFHICNDETTQWASLVIGLPDVFRRIGDRNFPAINQEADVILSELNSVITVVDMLRFATREPTPQLIGTYWGNIGLSGIITPKGREFIQHTAGETQETVHYPPGTQLMHALGGRALGSTPIGCGVGVSADGRFVSNAGTVMGTGSLEVLPSAVHDGEERGYFYTSHNLDSAFTQLWAFCGLAKLLGDAHRYYEQATA